MAFFNIVSPDPLSPHISWREIHTLKPGPVPLSFLITFNCFNTDLYIEIFKKKIYGSKMTFMGYYTTENDIRIFFFANAYWKISGDTGAYIKTGFTLDASPEWIFKHKSVVNLLDTIAKEDKNLEFILSYMRLNLTKNIKIP